MECRSILLSSWCHQLNAAVRCLTLLSPIVLVAHLLACAASSTVVASFSTIKLEWMIGLIC